MKSIFIDCNAQLEQVWGRVIRADDPKIVVNTAPFQREDVGQVLSDYEIALDDHSYMPTEIIKDCKSLKHIVFLGTGAASYMNVDELAGLGIKLHTIKGYGDIAVAEHTMALLMASARGVARMDAEVRAGTWAPKGGTQLYGKTLGLIGLGGIGAEFARMAQGFGMKVIAYNRTARADAPVPLVDLDTLLAQSDVISLHLTLGDETRGFVTPERIAKMKPGVILLNTARGALIDEDAMIAALKSGHIGHAGLDVFHSEPLKADNALTQLPNVTLTSHAGFRTAEASETLLRRAIDIVKSIEG